MNVREMQYDIRQKVNRLGTNQNQNLRIPELDWKINEAIDVFIKAVAQPRIPNHLGFETSQRSTDDVRTLVVDDKPLPVVKVDEFTYYAELPTEYNFFVSGRVDITKDACGSKTARAIPQQHDDRFQEDSFANSSYEWGDVNIYFYEKGIKIFTDGTFKVDKLRLDFIKKHPYVHNAQDFLPQKSYKDLRGYTLTGSQDCELPEHTHREIVDLAVLSIATDLQLPDYQIKQARLALNQLV